MDSVILLQALNPSQQVQDWSRWQEHFSSAVAIIHIRDQWERVSCNEAQLWGFLPLAWQSLCSSDQKGSLSQPLPEAGEG